MVPKVFEPLKFYCIIFLFVCFQIPRRYHGGEQGGGYHHGYSHRSHHYDYTDNGAGDTSGKETPSDSLKSMKSKSKGGAAGAGAGAGGTCCGVAAKTCCIIWLLILGALLLAIGLGLLTYYLLVNCKYSKSVLKGHLF